MFIVAALVVGLIPVVVLELVLRAAGVEAETTSQDPLVGFSGVSSLFELDADAGVYRTARSRRVLFGQQEFTAEKPAGGQRIFCLGGSTVRGRPYTTETAFARWMQLELSARDPSHPYEVVNCGGLSYASYRLTHIVEEVLNYEPDLLVVATGHNEFLEDRTYGDVKSRSSIRAWLEDRLHQLRVIRIVREWTTGTGGNPSSPRADRPLLPELVEPRLDQVSGYASYHRDDAWSADVETHFNRSVRTLVGMCRAADVPLVLVLVGANVRDCPPFKSEHGPGLSVEDERQWQIDFMAAKEQEESDPEQAVALYESAAALDNEYALLRFRMGRLLDRLGRAEEAAEHYLAAKDNDVCPLRMTESLSETVRLIAADTETPLVDARGIIEQRCPDRIPGNDWYMDHVHPSIGAHQLIGQAIVTCVADNELTPSLTPWSGAARRQTYRDHLNDLGPIYLTNGHERVRWVENWARRRRLLDETLPVAGDAHLRYGHRLWDFALRDQAWQHYGEALTANSELDVRLLERTRQLFEQGRAPEALGLLDRLAEVETLHVGGQIESLRQQIRGQDR